MTMVDPVYTCISATMEGVGIAVGGMDRTGGTNTHNPRGRDKPCQFDSAVLSSVDRC
jgi:hypothetical protein